MHKLGIVEACGHQQKLVEKLIKSLINYSLSLSQILIEKAWLKYTNHKMTDFFSSNNMNLKNTKNI